MLRAVFRVALATGPSPQRCRNSGSSLRAVSRRAARQRWPERFGWKSSGSTASADGSKPLKASLASNDVSESSGLHRLLECSMAGRLAGTPDAGDQNPDDRYISSSAVIRHGAIDACQDFLMARLQHALVTLWIPERLDSSRRQDPPVQRRVEPESPGQDIAEPPLVPADVGLRRFADHQVGLHRPADLAEVMPTLAGRHARERKCL